MQKFFVSIIFFINVVGASSKRIDQLRDPRAEEIVYMTSVDEMEMISDFNQIGTLTRAGYNRWSSHLKSVSSLFNMSTPTYKVLFKITEGGTVTIKKMQIHIGCLLPYSSSSLFALRERNNGDQGFT